jgi:hypothetical protein
VFLPSCREMWIVLGCFLYLLGWCPRNSIPPSLALLSTRARLLFPAEKLYAYQCVFVCVPRAYGAMRWMYLRLTSNSAARPNNSFIHDKPPSFQHTPRAIDTCLVTQPSCSSTDTRPRNGQNNPSMDGIRLWALLPNPGWCMKQENTHRRRYGMIQ